MTTMMASLVEWRSNRSPFLYIFFDFSFSWFPPPLPFFYPPLTFFLLFSYLPYTAHSCNPVGWYGNSFLHDDVRTSAISSFFSFVERMRVWNFASHHITLWVFLLTWTLGFTWEVHISYTIYPYGHEEMELDWNWYSNSLFRYIISRHTISYCVFPFFPFFPCVFFVILFAVLGWGEAVSTWNFTYYYYLCIICYPFSLLSSFIIIMPDIGQRLFLLSLLPSFCNSYIHPTCGLGRGTLYTACAVILSWSCFYTLTDGDTQWRYCITISV